MNIEIAAATGLVLFVFFLIQIARMKTISISQDGNGTTTPASIVNAAEKGLRTEINIRPLRLNDKFDDSRFIGPDSLN